MTVFYCPEYEYEAPKAQVTKQEAMAWWFCRECLRFVMRLCDGPRERP